MHQEDLELKEENKRDALRSISIFVLIVCLGIILYSDISNGYAYWTVMVLVFAIIYLANKSKPQDTCSSCGKKHLTHFWSLGLTRVDGKEEYVSVSRALCKECDIKFPELRQQYLSESQLKDELEKSRYP